MKRKLLCIGLVASLILSGVIPATALAKGGGFEEFHLDGKIWDFEATGIITGISPGEVEAAGNNGRWIVAERGVTVCVSEDGDMYTMTYAANVPIDTQAGSFHGTLEMDSLVFKVRGKNQPIEFAGLYQDPLYGSYPLYKLAFSGSWTIIKGTQGNGTFSGWAEFVPTAEGHISFIIASSFTMTGKWKPQSLIETNVGDNFSQTISAR